MAPRALRAPAGSSRPAHRRSLRRFLAQFVGATAAALLVATGLAVISALPSSAGTSTLTAPPVVYTGVGEMVAFSGTDPISNVSRVISMDASISGSCNPTSGNNWSISLCGRVQIGLTDGYGGLLNLPGTTKVQSSPDVYRTQSGAIVENPTSMVLGINMNGTLDQLNGALADLEYHPAADYEDFGTNVPNIDILVNDGSLASVNASAEIVLRVEGDNGAPTLDGPAAPLDAAAGTDTSYPASTSDPAVFSVIDPELCLPDPNNLCDGAYAQTAPPIESDDLMLLVGWIAEQNCGEFSFRGASGWTNLGSASLPSLNAILTDPTGLNLQQPQADAILATLPATAGGLDLSQQTGTPLDATTVFAGTASLDDVRYALSQLTFAAPPDDATCNLNLAVSDLGNNGMPLEWVAADDQAQPPVPAYEIPDAQADTISATFQVKDANPDVSITKVTPGTAGPNTPAAFLVTFSEDVTGFDDPQNDLDFSGSAGNPSATIVPTPGDASTYTVNAAAATSDGDITIGVPAAAAQAAASPNGDNEASPSTASIDWDQTNPEVTIDQAASQVDPTTGSSIVFEVVFSENVTGFATGDVTLAGTAGATTATVTGSGTTYTVT
ncbi:MAG: hypothetical protein MUF83_17470, partial [Acidimicrobiales bacterium]|nr:hypothetical protein [Acidimicrobiales bacterium]